MLIRDLLNSYYRKLYAMFESKGDYESANKVFAVIVRIASMSDSELGAVRPYSNA